VKPLAILCDIDGTIALRGDRSPHDHDSAMEDALNVPVIKMVESAALAQGWVVVLVSGRQEKYRDVTEYWLRAHNLFPDRAALIMRATGDKRPDDVVKRELYHDRIKPFYHVTVVFDDRDKVVKMWRSLSLVCLQVAPGDF
jgi:hypothetical protein